MPARLGLVAPPGTEAPCEWVTGSVSSGIRAAIGDLQALASNRSAVPLPRDFVDNFWGVQAVRGMTRGEQCIVSSSSRAPGNTLLVTVSNMGHLDLVVNWALSVVAQGVQRFVVVAVDGKLVSALREMHIPAIAMRKEWLTPPGTQQFDELTDMLNGDAATRAQKYETAAYAKLTKLKVLAVLSFLRAGYTVHLQDDDIGWVRGVTGKLHAFEGLLQKERTSIALMSDSAGGGDLSINTGQYVAQPRSDVMRLLRSGLEKGGLHDQERIIAGGNKYKLLRRDAPYNELGGGWRMETWVRNDETYSIGYYGCFKGRRAQHPVKGGNFEVASVHANWVIGVEKKVACLKENAAWFLPHGASTGLSGNATAQREVAASFASLPVHTECSAGKL